MKPRYKIETIYAAIVLIIFALWLWSPFIKEFFNIDLQGL